MTTPATPASTTSTSVTGFRHYDLKSIHVPHWLQTVGHHPRVVTGFVVAVAVVYGIWYERHKRRAEQINRVVATMASVLGCPDGMTLRHGWGNKPVRWEHGTIQVVKAKYPKKTVAPPKVRAQMEEALKELLEAPVDLRWDLLKGHLTMSRVKPVAEADAKTMGQLRQVFAVLDGATVTADEYDAGQVAAFTVTYAPTSADADEAWRAKMDGVVGTKTNREWVPTWLPHDHKVSYRTRPKLPTLILHPADLIVSRTALPFGESLYGGTTVWDIDSESPHCLVVGTSGSGKTSLLRTLILEATRRNLEVMICDTKRVSLLSLRNAPGISTYAGALDDMIALMHSVFTLQEDRYKAIETAIKDGRSLPDLPHVVFCLDEVWELLVRVDEQWKKDGNSGVAPTRTEFQSLARLGRECHIHLLLGMQRPDAKIVGGETRSNFGCRVLLGRGDKDSRGMVGITSHITSNARGRGIAAWGTEEAETQTYWTPDANGRLSESESDCLRSLGQVDAVRQVVTVQSPAVLSGNDLVTTPGNAPSNHSGNASGNLPAPLSAEQVAKIRAMRAGGATFRAIAETLGVSVKAAHKYGSQQESPPESPPVLRLVKD